MSRADRKETKFKTAERLGTGIGVENGRRRKSSQGNGDLCPE